MAHADNAVGDSAFAYLGAERLVNNGTMVVDFELNKKPFKHSRSGPPKPDRTDGDLLISLEYSNGGGNPIVTHLRDHQRRELRQRTDGRLRSRSATRRRSTPSAARPTSTSSRPRASATPSRLRLRRSVHRPLEARHRDGLPGLLSGHIRSRTGGDPASSQLKDTARPFPIDLNNCGKVTIVKDAHPESGTNFDYTTTGGNSLSDFSLEDDGDNDDALADTKTFDAVVPGTYTVTEAAKAGWKLTDLDCDDGNSTVNVDTRRRDDQRRQQRTRHLHVHQHQARQDHRREADRA